MTDPVRAHALAQPDAAAVVTPHETWTWADLDRRVSAVAGRLVTVADATPLGPTIAVVARTQPALVAVLLGALRAGVAVAPLSPRWPPAALAGALSRLGLRHLVTDDPALALPAVETCALTDLIAPGDDTPAGEIALARSFTVVHTSGTMGAPRAAAHSVGAHVESARGLAARLPLGPSDRWLLDLPLAHVGGLGVVVRCALAGAAVAIPDAGTSTADALRILTPTHASLVSTQLVRLLREADAPPVGLRAILLGASAIPPGLLDAAHAAGWPVATSYGLTEMTSTVTATGPGASREALATSGAVLPGRELRIAADGEILVRGATLFSGYVEAGGLTRPLDADGWYATGDLGQLDADGRLTVTGRLGNRFVSGGENVQPEAIEAALAALPGVAEAVVVPVPDAEFGFRPVAFVRPRGDVMPSATVLATALRRTLPGYLVPTAFHEWSGTDGMKPDRRSLAAEAARRALRSG